MRTLSLLCWLLSGCVVKKYGAPEGASAPLAGPSAAASAVGADFTALEARIDALLSSAVELDERDRLLAAADLARQSRRLPAEAQRVNHAFLSTLVAIEERDVPYAAPVLMGGGRGAAEVESVDAPLAIESPAAQSPALDAAALSASARERLAAGDASGALAILEPCRGQPCWEAVAPVWSEAEDALVFRAREEAGARYLASRQIADEAARLDALREVRDSLAELLRRYPESRYAEAIQRNLTLVEGDIAAIGAP